jgi:hypothetical protein
VLLPLIVRVGVRGPNLSFQPVSPVFASQFTLPRALGHGRMRRPADKLIINTVLMGDGYVQVDSGIDGNYFYG